MWARIQCRLFGHETWSDLEGRWFCMRCLEAHHLGRADDARPLATALRSLVTARARHAAIVRSNVRWRRKRHTVWNPRVFPTAR